MVYMTRIGCIVAGIGAIIGVLGIMNHYHAENLPLNPEIWNRYNPSSKLELCILRVAWKLWYSLMPDKLQKTFVQASSLILKPFQMLCCNKK